MMIGSCRDVEDEARVKTIKSLCEELNVSSNVEFRVNISFEELKDQLTKAVLGLHTMWNEHFGIGKLTIILLYFVCSFVYVISLLLLTQTRCKKWIIRFGL